RHAAAHDLKPRPVRGSAVSLVAAPDVRLDAFGLCSSDQLLRYPRLADTRRTGEERDTRLTASGAPERPEEHPHHLLTIDECPLPGRGLSGRARAARRRPRRLRTLRSAPR